MRSRTNKKYRHGFIKRCTLGTYYENNEMQLSMLAPYIFTEIYIESQYKTN